MEVMMGHGFIRRHPMTWVANKQMLQLKRGISHVRDPKELRSQLVPRMSKIWRHRVNDEVKVCGANIQILK